MKASLILSQMTLEEKAKLLQGKHNWFLNGVPRLGIRDFIVADGPHGLRAYENIMENNGVPETRQPATMFPCASAMASTFNPNLIYQVGSVIGKECNHYNVDIILAPGVNGKRSPLAGRNFEYYSEDPFLTKEMGVSFVNGVQHEGVGTSVKHFILNEQESTRRFISSEVDQRVFRELYAYPFEEIIKESNPLTIMPSYNKVKGVYSCQNQEILRDLLRKQWNFKGITLSDWGAVQNKKESVYAGLDIEMPEPEWKDSFIQEVLDGKYDTKLIDETAERILNAYEWMLSNENHGQPTDFMTNHLVARNVANEAICLLKNEDVLPLSVKETVLIIGEYAKNPRIGGGGSSDLMPFLIENPLEEIKKMHDVTYINSYEYTDEVEKLLSLHSKCIIFTGTTSEIESEGHDRLSLQLPLEQIQLVQKVAEQHASVIVINSSGSAVDFTPFLNQIKGLIQTFFLGSACGKAIADILYGKVNPSGRLSETFPLRIENVSTFPQFPGTGQKVTYQEGLFTGYRFFDTHEIPVMFPFGYGLSYSKFEYKFAPLTRQNYTKTEMIQIPVEIKNTSDIDGYETLMVFVHYPTKDFIHPKKTLKTFKKVFVKAHEAQPVTLLLPVKELKTFDALHDSFIIENGVFQVDICKNVNEVIYQYQVKIDSHDIYGNQPSLDYPVSIWSEYPKTIDFIVQLQEKYRHFNWWEMEEPLNRILLRMKNEFKISDSDYQNIISKLCE